MSIALCNKVHEVEVDVHMPPMPPPRSTTEILNATKLPVKQFIQLVWPH